MRNRQGIAFAALALAGVVAFASVAGATVTGQSVTGQTTPSKLPKKKRAGVKLKVSVDTTYDGACGPACSPYGLSAVVDFDNDFAFDNAGLAQCNPGNPDLNGPPDQAKAACRKAYVGSGNAHLEGAAGPLEAVVTAFNGTNAPDGKDRIVLASWVPGLSVSSILTGTLSAIHDGDYGWRLNVTIPPIAGGSQVITHFDTAVRRAYTYKGKKHNFAAARCKDKNRLLNYRETTTFNDASTAGGTDTQPCTVKRTARHHRRHH